MFELEDIVREPFPKIGITDVGDSAVRGLCNLKNYSPSKVEIKAVAVYTDHGEMPTTDTLSFSEIHFVEAPLMRATVKPDTSPAPSSPPLKGGEIITPPFPPLSLRGGEPNPGGVIAGYGD